MKGTPDASRYAFTGRIRQYALSWTFHLYLLLTVVLAHEVVDVYALDIVQRAPDKVLYSGGLRCIDQVLSELCLFCLGLRLVKVVLEEEAPN